MKAVLNVKGTKLSVLSIHYAPNGNLFTVRTIDEDGREEVYVDAVEGKFITNEHSINLEEALEYPELEARIVEGNNKLIKHLEDMQKEEDSKLLEILTEMGELEEELPFDSLAKRLVAKQIEYKCAQQRVFGIIDTLEEVKAFMEGNYANVDDETVTA